MKIRHPRFVRLVLAAVFATAAGLVVVELLQPNRPPLIISGAYRSGGGGHVTMEIRNNAPDRVRLYSVWLWARIGSDWALVGTVPLGFTNCTARSVTVELEFPTASPPPWKATLVYMPAFSRMKLLRARLQETWSSKSVRRGFLTTGWEGSRRIDSPEIAP